MYRRYRPSSYWKVKAKLDRRRQTRSVRYPLIDHYPRFHSRPPWVTFGGILGLDQFLLNQPGFRRAAFQAVPVHYRFFRLWLPWLIVDNIFDAGVPVRFRITDSIAFYVARVGELADRRLDIVSSDF